MDFVEFLFITLVVVFLGSLIAVTSVDYSPSHDTKQTTASSSKKDDDYGAQDAADSLLLSVINGM